MGSIVLFGFKEKNDLKEKITGFLQKNFTGIDIKNANSKESCFKILKNNKVLCIFINQIDTDSELLALLKNLEQNINYSQIPLIGINSSRNNLNLSISGSFIATIFLPINFSDLKLLMEKNIPLIKTSGSAVQNKQNMRFSFKEKYDTRKSCFARCEVVKNSKGKPVDYRFLEINPEFAEFLNLMIEDIYSGSIKKLFPQLGEEIVTMMNETPDNGKPLYYEYHSTFSGKHFELIAYKQSSTVVNTIIIDTTQRVKEEEAIKKQKELFGERVKELRCLYNITRILNENNLSVRETMKKMVLIIPWAFKYPEIAKVKITIWDKVETSVDFEDTDWKIEESVIVQQRRIGKISISYVKKRPNEYVGPFLKEEVSLLRSICELLASSVEKWAAQKDLFRMNERLDLAYKAADLGIWDWNISNDKLFLNSKYLEMLGEKILINETNHNKWLNLIHPDDKEFVEKNIDENLNGLEDIYSKEFRIKTKKGNWIWVKDTGKIVKRDKFGKPLRMLGMIRDVNNEKGNELELTNRLQYEKILRDILRFCRNLRDEELEQGLKKIILDFSKFIQSDYTEYVFYKENKSKFLIKEVKENKFLGKNCSLIFSNDSREKIYSLLKEYKIVEIPGKVIDKKFQNEILEESGARNLIFLPIKNNKGLIGYNLHCYYTTPKQISSNESLLFDIFSEIISNIKIRIDLYNETGTHEYEKDVKECLIETFLPGLIHEVNSPSQYVVDNLDYIYDITVKYSGLVEDFKIMSQTNGAIETNIIKEKIDQKFSNSKAGNVFDDFTEAFHHSKIGIQNICDTISAIEAFCIKNDDKSYVEINRILKKVLDFTRNEWKNKFEIKINFDETNPTVFAHLYEINRVFLYILLNMIYLTKKKTYTNGGKKYIDIKISSFSKFVKVMLNVKESGISVNDLNSLIKGENEVEVAGWRVSNKFQYCLEVIEKKLDGKFIVETKKGDSHSISVTIPVK